MPPPARRLTLKHRLALLSGSLLVFAGLLGLAELVCRLALDINPRGNSRNLLVKEAFGPSKGNTKNVHALSFGAEIVTDEFGFRIDPARPEPARDSAVLFLGDSVAFGPGVTERDSFVGRFRTALPAVRVYNSSVIGYSLPDYLHVAERFVPAHPEIKRVYLMYCLNDLSDQSATLIDEALSTPQTSATPAGGVDTVRRLPGITAANFFLREHSRLYLWLSVTLTGTSQRYFQADLKLYDVDDARLAALLQPIADIAALLAQRHVDFVVGLLPYEMQVRDKDPALRRPQQRITEYLRAHGIASIDLWTPVTAAKPSSTAYLFGDPMHFSTLGHQIVFDALWTDWQRRPL